MAIMPMDEDPGNDIRWLLTLMTWMSPSYPVGAFAYSHGIEWAVLAGKINTRQDLEAYISTVIEAGGGWCDLVLLAAAWRAAREGGDADLDEVADIASAWRGTAETAMESRLQGAAFARATAAAWPGTALDALAARRGGEVPFPVAVGAASAGFPLEAVLPAYAHNIAANLVSAGVRLVPLGQTDGVRALAALVPVIAAAAARAAGRPLDLLSTSAPRIDLASIRHETQYTRLFRS